MEIARRSLWAAAVSPDLSQAAAKLPLVPFGKAKVSKLTAGGNPVSGFSHQSPALDAEMMDYFSAANVKKMLLECERAGINTWQSRADRHILRLLREYRNEGGSIQWIAQTASELANVPRNIRDAAAAGAIGIYHHGAMTDQLWWNRKIEQVQDRLKLMHDLGVRAGLATHIPEVIDYVEEHGWEVDFYMTCVYNLSRPHEEALELAGGPLTGEFFYEPDRGRMLARVRQTSRQCLIFKVYGAGRRCSTEQDRRAALAEALEAAKPGDCVVIGMYPKRSNQVADNVRLVLECLAARS